MVSGSQASIRAKYPMFFGCPLNSPVPLSVVASGASIRSATAIKLSLADTSQISSWLSLQIVCMTCRLRLQDRCVTRRSPVQCVETIAGSCRDIWSRCRVAPQQTLQLAASAVHRLNVKGVPNPLSARQVARVVADTHSGGAGRTGSVTIAHQHDIPVHDGFDDLAQGSGIDRRKTRTDRHAAAVGSNQHRNLFIRKAAPCGPAAARPCGSPGHRSRRPRQCP